MEPYTGRQTFYFTTKIFYLSQSKKCFTVSGLAKLEGEVIDIEDNMFEEPPTTKYQLTGIVVHSGQASGGHYFSFILHK